MLKEIIEAFAKIEIYEKRDATDSYYEAVFHNKDVGELEKALGGIFGPAVKPVKKKPAKEDSLITRDFGGIRGEQTLFRKDADGVTIIAMLWPWQDALHTTLKIAILKQ